MEYRLPRPPTTRSSFGVVADPRVSAHAHPAAILAKQTARRDGPRAHSHLPTDGSELAAKRRITAAQDEAGPVGPARVLLFPSPLTRRRYATGPAFRIAPRRARLTGSELSRGGRAANGSAEPAWAGGRPSGQFAARWPR